MDRATLPSWDGKKRRSDCRKSPSIRAGVQPPHWCCRCLIGAGHAQCVGTNQQGLFDQLGFPFYQSASTMVKTAAPTVASINFSHGSQITADGHKLLLGIGQNPWRQDFRPLGNPNQQVQVSSRPALALPNTFQISQFTCLLTT